MLLLPPQYLQKCSISFFMTFTRNAKKIDQLIQMLLLANLFIDTHRRNGPSLSYAI
jgi:hypothetical protein